eukprot:TRINITY_DN28775_c0_g1_i1.p1 TRINITY_DN28775_c0_g1~~TRINITY_DN28775_c0_g1_i1.p1  ORF type:complete len:437 (-),score=85.81 TRINITY_DN28775_c0_g1_i1:25-1335(-)
MSSDVTVTLMSEGTHEIEQLKSTDMEEQTSARKDKEMESTSTLEDLKALDKQVDGMEKVSIDIPEDAYGAAILAVVRDVTKVRQGKSWSDEEVQLSLIQASFSFGLLALNLVLQFSLLGFISLYVVNPSVQNVQAQYQRFHSDMFDFQGQFLADQWAKAKNKDLMCDIGLSDPWFYKCVVLLWVLLIIREFRTTERLTRDLCCMPTCNELQDMEISTDDRCEIVAITKGVRLLLVVLVSLPKFCICLTLLLLGCSWLTATTSFTDLVMNSIAMEFVTNIDENLYETLLPVAHRQQVEDVNFVYKRKVSSQTKKQFEAFKRSGLYLCISVAFVFLYPRYVQNVLPHDLSDLKAACADIVEAQQQSVCDSPFWSGSAGVDRCFPFGESTYRKFLHDKGYSAVALAHMQEHTHHTFHGKGRRLAKNREKQQKWNQTIVS